MGLTASTQLNQDWEHDHSFWKTYYEKTGDYSTGIGRTITLNAVKEMKQKLNRLATVLLRLKSRNIYYKYKGKEHRIPVKTNRFQ